MVLCLDCPPVIVAPAGEDADDASNVQAAAEANAYKAPVQLSAGTFVFKTPCHLSSGTVLVGSPDTRIVSEISPNGDVANATFVATPVLTNIRTTLVASNIPGSNTITTEDEIAPGSLVILSGGGNGLRAQYYTVDFITGSGPYILTLDRPVLGQYVVADSVTVAASRPEDIQILGNGMTITGTAERYGELSGAYRSMVTVRPTAS